MEARIRGQTPDILIEELFFIAGWLTAEVPQKCQDRWLFC